MRQIIYQKLNSFFLPSFLDVTNLSHLHEGHVESSNSGNTHFHIKITSKKFLNLSRVDSQRLIYEVLDEEMKEGVHSLIIEIINN